MEKVLLCTHSGKYHSSKCFLVAVKKRYASACVHVSASQVPMGYTNSGKSVSPFPLMYKSCPMSKINGRKTLFKGEALVIVFYVLFLGIVQHHMSKNQRIRCMHPKSRRRHRSAKNSTFLESLPLLYPLWLDSFSLCELWCKS